MYINTRISFTGQDTIAQHEINHASEPFVHCFVYLKLKLKLESIGSIESNILFLYIQIGKDIYYEKFNSFCLC